RVRLLREPPQDGGHVVSVGGGTAQLGPVDGRGHRGTGPGPNSVGRDRVLAVCVAQVVEEHPLAALVLALLRRHLLRVVGGQGLRDRTGEVPDGPEVRAAIEWDLHVEAPRAGGLDERRQPELVQQAPQGPGGVSSRPRSSTDGSRSKVSWSGWSRSSSRASQTWGSTHAWSAKYASVA